MKKIENPNTTPIAIDKIREQIRAVVDSYYDLQKIRVSYGNRIFAAFKDSADQEEVDKLLKDIVSEYKLVVDALVKNPNIRVTTFIKKNDTLRYIKNKFYYDMLDSYNSVYEAENKAYASIKEVVHQHWLWDAYFKDLLGVGEICAALCFSYLDIHKARHVSSFWSYAGLGTRVNEKGERVAMSKRALTTRTYIDKDGNEQTCKSLGYNPKLHSFLLGVLPSSVFKAGARSNKESKLFECFTDTQNRYMNKPNYADASKAHIFRIAAREMAKLLLQDLWVIWREHEGYEISQPYAVEYLGRAPHKYNEFHERKATV